jgi:hypothetical protein
MGNIVPCRICKERCSGDTADVAFCVCWPPLSTLQSPCIVETSADDITSKGNMWRVSDFKAWLALHHGSDQAWNSCIVPGMKRAVVGSLKCCQTGVRHREGSCQLYGYDFIVDEACKVWLLEINSSPTMEYSTEITADLCERVQDDVLKVCLLQNTGGCSVSLVNVRGIL